MLVSRGFTIFCGRSHIVELARLYHTGKACDKLGSSSLYLLLRLLVCGSIGRSCMRKSEQAMPYFAHLSR